MNKIFLIFLLLFYNVLHAQQNKAPDEAAKLMRAYPHKVIRYDNNYIIFNDSTKLIFDSREKIVKSHMELINEASIKDMFVYTYPRDTISQIKKNQDPGRIRNTDFFKKMYGETAQDVQKNLKEIVWCPKLVGQKLKVTSINDVHKRLEKISSILDEHPEWKKYLKSAGTFYWRKVRGSNNLSAHSFGIAIDLDIKYSNYWQWDCKCNDENVNLPYKNRFPWEIVKIFEDNGFIWGGKWYHYDTMHFEYRPELLLNF